MGADRPPNGARQRKFWPLIAHLSMSLVSGETPSRLGPRASGQSPRATLRGPCAEPVTAASVASANARATRHMFLSIGFIVSISLRRSTSIRFTLHPPENATTKSRRREERTKNALYRERTYDQRRGRKGRKESSIAQRRSRPFTNSKFQIPNSKF